MRDGIVLNGVPRLCAVTIVGIALGLTGRCPPSAPLFCDLGPRDAPGVVPTVWSFVEPAVVPTLWWSFAATRNTPEAWDVAAAVYGDAVRRCIWLRPVGEHAACVDAAFSAVLARKNAWSAEAARATSVSLDVQPLRVRALFDATDTFVVLAFPDDRGWMINEFREALLLWSLQQARVIPALFGERADRLRELHAGLDKYMARFPAANDALRALGFDPRFDLDLCPRTLGFDRR